LKRQYFYNNLQVILGHIAHNVPVVYRSRLRGIKDFGDPDKQTVARAEPPTGGEAYTDLLCEVPAPFYFLIIIHL
jgi:hypothetical protein